MCHISAAAEWLRSGGGRAGETSQWRPWRVLEESSVGTRHWRRQHGVTRHTTVSNIVSIVLIKHISNHDGQGDRMTI